MDMSVRLADFYKMPPPKSILGLHRRTRNRIVLNRDEGERLRSLVDGGDEHARTGRGDLLVIRGGRLALLGTPSAAWTLQDQNVFW